MKPPYQYSDVTFRHGDRHFLMQWMLPRLADYDEPRSIVRAMCDGYMDNLHPGVRVCGDKSPAFGALHPDGSGRRIWEDLRELWPDCKLLFMDRPLEDAVASAIKVWPDQDPCERWRMARERLEGQQLCPDALWVRLAELNAKPSEVIRQVLDWAGLPAHTYPWRAALQHFTVGHRIN